MKKTITLILSIFLLAAILGATLLWKNHHEKSQNTALNKTRNHELITKHNIELNPTKRIHARSLPGTSLIDHHPWLQQAIENHEYTKETLQLGKTYDQTLTNFRKTLGKTLAQNANDQQVIQAMFDALNKNPTQENKFKQAVKKSTNLGPKYLSESQGFFKTSYLNEILQRIELRAFCEVNLNLPFSDSVETITRTIHLINHDGFGVIAKFHAASLNAKLHTLTLNAITAPNTSPETLTKLLKLTTPSSQINYDFKCIEDEFAFAHHIITTGPKLPTHKLDQEGLMHMTNYFLYLRLDENDQLNTTLTHQITKDAYKRISKEIEDQKPAIKMLFDKSYEAEYLDLFASTHLEIDIIRLLTATKIHQLTHGQYPKSLTELTPTILPELPTQPFNNKPYTYTPPKNPKHLPTITGQFKTTKETIKISSQDLTTSN